MTSLVLSQFTGMAPQVSEHQLAPNAAVLASDCTFKRGRLDPLKEVTDIGESTIATYNSLFYYEAVDTWLTDTDVDWVGTILPQDNRDRIYSTDQFYPKVRSGVSLYRLGIPRPDAAPAFVVQNAGDQTEEFAMNTQSYVMTFVDAWGAEGPPSPATISVDVGPGFSVQLTAPSPPAGNYNFGAGSVCRFYRSNAGTVETAYQYLGDAPFTGTFIDTFENDELQEVIPSETWIGPPDDDSAVYPSGPLQGLISLPNGSLAGFSGNQVCVSLPYLPHAWPLTYRFSAEFPVIGLAPILNGVLVTTTSHPYILAGNDPESMVLVKLESVQACKSKRSIVDMGDYAIYAGDDGLVRASGADVAVITKDFIDRDTWQETYHPDTIRAFQYEGTYVAYYGAAAANTGFIFDPRGGSATFTHVSGQVMVGWNDAVNDRVIVNHFNGAEWSLGSYDTGADKEYTWKSRVFRYPHEIGFSVIRVDADSYPVQITLTTDGVAQPALSIPDNGFHRLPYDFIAHEWQVEIVGTTGVEIVGLWDSFAEAI